MVITPKKWRYNTWNKVSNHVESGSNYHTFISLVNLMEECSQIVTDELTEAGYTVDIPDDRMKELAILIRLHDEATDLISQIITLHNDLHYKLGEISEETLSFDHPMAISVQLVQIQVANTHSRVQQLKHLLSMEYKTLGKFKDLSDETNLIANRAADLSLTGIFWGAGGFIMGITSFYLTMILG